MSLVTAVSHSAKDALFSSHCTLLSVYNSVNNKGDFNKGSTVRVESSFVLALFSLQLDIGFMRLIKITLGALRQNTSRLFLNISGLNISSSASSFPHQFLSEVNRDSTASI